MNWNIKKCNLSFVLLCFCRNICFPSSFSFCIETTVFTYALSQDSLIFDIEYWVCLSQSPVLYLLSSDFSIHCWWFIVGCLVVLVQCWEFGDQSPVFSVEWWELSVQCSVSSFQCSVFSVHCSVFSVQCSVFSFQSSVLSVQCSVFSVQCLVFSV